MRQLLKHIIIAALLSAAIGAVAGFFLSESLPEGAIAGAILGLFFGAFLGARIDAHRAAIAAAERDPAEAARQARGSNARLDAASEFARHNQKTRDSIGGIIDGR